MEAEEKKNSVYDVLSVIDCADKIEKKNNLSYLSWSYAWGELLKKYPDSTYKIYENNEGWNYFTDGRTCWVKTGVTVNGVERIEYLPVMDFRNKSIPANAVTSTDVNKTIQRSITKAIARHGLGLYIYAGEDLPEDCSEEVKQEQKPTTNTSGTGKNSTSNNTVKKPTAEPKKTVEPKQLTPQEECRYQELCVKFEEYENSGLFANVDKSYIDKAKYYINMRDVDGLEKMIAWCQSQNK